MICPVGVLNVGDSFVWWAHRWRILAKVRQVSGTGDPWVRVHCAIDGDESGGLANIDGRQFVAPLPGQSRKRPAIRWRVGKHRRGRR